MDGTVVVVGTSYRAGPWACRSLKAAGWRVVGMHPVDDGRGRSTACLSPRRCPSAVSDMGEFGAAVVATCREVGARAVLPIGEECVRSMAGAAAADLGATRLVGPDPAQYGALCDKGTLGDSAARVGVGHPRSVAVTADGPDGEWPPLPSVVKTRVGLAPDGESPALTVASAGARERALAALIRAGHDAVVEELIDAPQWTVHAVRDAEGRFAAVPAAVQRTYPRGVGTPTVFEVGAADHPAVAATRLLLESIDYRGPANAQFFLRDGQVLVHDVNLRLPASVALAMRAGLDLPAHGVAVALGGPLPPVRPPAVGLRYVSIGDEVRSMLGRGNGGPPAREVARDLMRGAFSSGAMLDPPLSDPLWISSDLAAGARSAARRAVRRVIP